MQSPQDSPACDSTQSPRGAWAPRGPGGCPSSPVSPQPARGLGKGENTSKSKVNFKTTLYHSKQRAAEEQLMSREAQCRLSDAARLLRRETRQRGGPCSQPLSQKQRNWIKTHLSALARWLSQLACRPMHQNFARLIPSWST